MDAIKARDKMIYVNDSSYVSAAKKAFLALLDSGRVPNDATVLKEDSALIEISDISQNDGSLDVGPRGLSYSFDLKKYYPNSPTDTKMEMTHWNGEFIRSGKVKKVIAHLRSNPSSRRAIIDLWASKYSKNLDKPAVCVSQLYFRMIDGKLDMHSHSRANDAYRLLMMDMQVMMTIQKTVADKLGVKPGRFVHFVDSLHLYKRDVADIKGQQIFMAESNIWA